MHKFIKNTSIGEKIRALAALNPKWQLEHQFAERFLKSRQLDNEYKAGHRATYIGSGGSVIELWSK